MTFVTTFCSPRSLTLFVQGHKKNLFYTNYTTQMIGLKGTLNVIDNSGAIIAECIKVMSGARFARAGNAIKETTIT